MKARIILVVLALAATSCVESDPLTATAGKAERTLDLTGTDQAADLSTAENSAKATVALVNTVTTAALIIGELGSAAGDLFPNENNPCPGGGSASSSVGGSFNHPRLHMTFSSCVRGDFTLDGQASITCDDLNGSSCPSGSIYVGEGNAVLHFMRPEGIVLMVGNADISADEASQHLHAIADLKGEIRSADETRSYSFVTEALDLDIQRVSEGRAEVRISGVAAMGGGAEQVNCITGRFDSETPADPLIIDADILRSGFLRLHSPPPRPGMQQAESTYLDGSLDVKGANGEQRRYTPEALAEFCAP